MWFDRMSETVIRVSNVSKTYQLGPLSSLWSLPSTLWNKRRDGLTRKEVFWALRDVSFEVKRGETLGIVGANGAGKSTLLKILCRVTEQTQGEVSIIGSVAPLIELGAGFHPELTGRENIYLNAAIMGMSRKTVESRFDEIVEFAELRSFIDTPVKKYSSGMLVRLGFSVAAHVDADILLVDEVLSVGDYRFQRKCLGKMREFIQKGGTIVLVSHHFDLLRSICQHGIFLREGKIRLIGAMGEVIQRYAIDSPSINQYSSGKPEDAPIWIRKAEVMTQQGIESYQFEMFSPMVIRIHYEARQAISKPAFGLSIWTKDNIRITTLDTRLSGKSVEVLSGSGFCECVIGSAALLPGRYLIKAGIYDGETTWPYHRIGWEDDPIEFVVVQREGGGDVFLTQEHGIIAMAASWCLSAS